MIAAVILAAGASSRMGEVKALLPLSGEILLARLARLSREAGAEEVVVAVGPPHCSRILAALPPGARAAYNGAPERGMLSSVQTALRELLARSAGLTGALLWPVDVPLVGTATLRQLLAADRTRLLIPCHEERGGHPIWLPASLFAEILQLPATSTLRELRQRHPALRVPVADAGILRNLNTRADFEQAQAALLARGP